MVIRGDAKIVTRVRAWDEPGALEEAARLLGAGDVVAFPTETVYGLGALCSEEAAVRRIFAVKGRPADNPLIVHVGHIPGARALAREWTPTAQALAEAFWPGPLTLVVPGAHTLPTIVSAGLDTVALRMPAHPCALALVSRAGAIAAPSANLSGRPSPTKAEHVFADLHGRVPLVLDGGPCEKGLESTVLDITGEVPAVLRPGHVTAGDVAAVAGDVRIAPGVLGPLPEGAKAASPGVMHRHYAPRSSVTVFRGEEGAVRASMMQEYAKLKEAGFRPLMVGTSVWEGCESRTAATAEALAREFYAILLESEKEYSHLLVQGVDMQDVGLALMNRAMRAADFSVKVVDGT